MIFLVVRGSVMNPRLLKRYSWIEKSIRIGGPFPVEKYKEAFDISSQQVSHDLNEFCEILREKNIDVVKSYGKIHADLPSDPVFTDLDARKWLSDVKPGCVVNVYPPVVENFESNVFDVLLEAIKKDVCVRGVYTSLRSGERKILLSPHALVAAVGREHVRAYDHDKNRFGDYNLSRISVLSLDQNTRFISSDSDIEWNTIIDIHIKPEDGLSDSKRRAVMMGLGISEFESRTITTRKALYNYMLQSFGIMPPDYARHLNITQISR